MPLEQCYTICCITPPHAFQCQLTCLSYSNEEKQDRTRRGWAPSAPLRPQPPPPPLPQASGPLHCPRGKVYTRSNTAAPAEEREAPEKPNVEDGVTTCERPARKPSYAAPHAPSMRKQAPGCLSFSRCRSCPLFVVLALFVSLCFCFCVYLFFLRFIFVEWVRRRGNIIFVAWVGRREEQMLCTCFGM